MCLLFPKSLIYSNVVSLSFTLIFWFYHVIIWDLLLLFFYTQIVTYNVPTLYKVDVNWLLLSIHFKWYQNTSEKTFDVPFLLNKETYIITSNLRKNYNLMNSFPNQNLKKEKIGGPKTSIIVHCPTVCIYDCLLLNTLYIKKWHDCCCSLLIWNNLFQK